MFRLFKSLFSLFKKKKVEQKVNFPVEMQESEEKIDYGWTRLESREIDFPPYVGKTRKFSRSDIEKLNLIKSVIVPLCFSDFNREVISKQWSRGAGGSRTWLPTTKRVPDGASC